MTSATKVYQSRYGAVGKSKRFPAESSRCEALDQTIIAELTGDMIDNMNRDEMVRVIHAVKSPTLFGFDSDRSLSLYDCETLRRLAYKARRCCQNLRETSQDA